jgi:hypothetical protein
MLNQWCYANPEPLNVAGPAEEMLAMTSGCSGQRTSIMTQLICYRVLLAPKGVKPDNPPKWLSRCPDANFISIPPDVLSEATWSMLAKPVDAIMYHGWGTVFETGDKKSYVFTNEDSAKRLKDLFQNVISPLGPALKRLGREKPQVAVLESFTTVAMGGGGSWGWTAPVVTFLQRARLDPRVIYEDMVKRGDLKDVKVLYAPQCQFLPESVIKEIRAFQSRGGILLGDALAETHEVGALHSDLDYAHRDACDKTRNRGGTLLVGLVLDARLHLLVFGLANIARGIAHLLTAFDEKRHERIKVEHHRSRVSARIDARSTARRKRIGVGLHLFDEFVADGLDLCRRKIHEIPRAELRA